MTTHHGILPKVGDEFLRESTARRGDKKIARATSRVRITEIGDHWVSFKMLEIISEENVLEGTTICGDGQVAKQFWNRMTEKWVRA